MADKKQLYKNKSYTNQETNYLQTRLTAAMPILMLKVVQTENGKFLFSHSTFPDLRIEGMTIGFVEEHLERAIRKQLRGQSDKHIDYLFDLLVK